MSDFVRDVQDSVIVDLFGDSKGTPPAAAKFGLNTDNNVDIFPSTVDTTTVASTIDTTTIQASSVGDTTTQPLTDVDILGDASKTPGRKAKYNFTDASGYFKDRMEQGKFVRIEEEAQDGSKKLFIPSTPEDFDEVIETQVNHRFEQEKKSLTKEWYESKSPAWRAVAQYAEMVDDPAQILPFIQGVKTIQSVASYDENTLEGAEQIVRTRLEQRGDPKEAIDSQIDALRTTEKLIPTGKQYKPVILQQEQQELHNKMAVEQKREAEWNNMVTDIRDKAVKSIEQPIFGKEKLKQEEKAAIYELIAQPSERDGGYGIFGAIDQLFEKRDFDTLKQIALLLTNKDSFNAYFGKSVANNTAAALTRKLVVATDNRTSGNDQDGDDENTVTRGQFKKSARFGRQ